MPTKQEWTGYIKNRGHFINYINLFIRESSVIDATKCRNAEEYVDAIPTHRVPRFTYAIRENVLVLEWDNFCEWLGRVPKPRQKRASPTQYTLEFTNLVVGLVGNPGVYVFHDNESEWLYVGMSTDLGARIPTSFTERASRLRECGTTYLSVIATETMSDAALFEVYLIAANKPRLNTAYRFDDGLSVVVDIPKFTKPVVVEETKT